MAKRRAKRTISPSSRFDGEAIGLVLFAVGIFLGVTVLLPPTASGFMADTHELLVGWGGWAAYLLFVPPVSYGVLVFLGRDLRNLTRRLAGGVLVVLSLLCLHDLFVEGAAGLLASRAMAPLLGTVSYFAAVLPVLTLTLGVEVFLAWPRLTIAKGFFRGLSVALAAALLVVRDALESRSAGREQVRDRTSARNLLLAHQRDLAALEQVFPQSRELEEWKRETRDALRGLSRLDEDGLKRLLGELNAWRDLLREFVSKSAQALRSAVLVEAPEAGADVEAVAQDIRKNRHDLSGELGAAMASGALEGVRRVLVMDVLRLASRAAALEKDRKRAEKALEKADTDVLSRELPKHQGRVKEWAELEGRFAEWQVRSGAYPGWPELAVRFDQAPADLTSALAMALQQDPDVTLQERARWEARLTEAPQAPVSAVIPAAQAAAPVVPVAAAEQAAVVAPVPAQEPAGPDVTTAPAALPEALVAPVPALIDLDFTGMEHAAQPAGQQAAPEVAAAAATAGQVVALADALLAEQAADAAPVQVPVPVPVPVGAAAGSAPARTAEAGGYVPQGTIRTESPPWEEEDETADAGGPAQPPAVPAQGAIDMQLPSFDLLDPVPRTALDTSALDAMAHARAELINETLTHFGLQARVVDHARGPTVTRYEIEPAPGEKISRIASLSNDLARALAVGGVRVEAPVPGKSVIGLEVPNAEREPVTFHTAAVGPAFRSPKAKLPIILGKSIDGEMVVGDLAKMPHLLIAGSTGSGKSVCVNTLICSLLFRYMPTELRFLMVDPKMVELTPYDGIPHLVRNVVTNPSDAAGVLLGAVAHMERRYKMMSQVGAKNLEQFNAKMRQVNEPELPHLVIIIDELADLMITSPKEVESAIMRLAQMARATGMHLVLATQRPSVDILTSLIKVNVPARVAFAVSSSHDSRTILDAVGAERLTGMGDMLFYQPGLVKPLRLQGPYISETETTRVTEFLRRQVFEDWFGETYGMDFEGVLDSGNVKGSGQGGNMDFSDPYLRSAAEICIEEGQGSVSRLQRRLSVGHARAGKLMDMLEAMGIVSKHQGSKPREVLITRDDLPEYFGR